MLVSKLEIMKEGLSFGALFGRFGTPCVAGIRIDARALDFELAAEVQSRGPENLAGGSIPAQIAAWSHKCRQGG